MGINTTPGTMVQYVSSKGYVKPALIVNNKETVVEGKENFPQITGELNVHLMVFSLTNGVSGRVDVKHESDAVTVEAAANPDQIGYWRNIPA